MTDQPKSIFECLMDKQKLKVGDVVPLPRPKLSIRPAFTGPGTPSHRPARKPGKFGS